MKSSPEIEVEARQDGLFRLAFAHAPVGVGLVSSEETWVQVNRELCSIFGCAEDQIVGKRIDERIAPEDRPALFRLMRRTSKTAQEPEAEVRFCAANGEQLTLCVRSSAFSPPGGPDYFVLQLQDISARKNAEGELRESEVRYRLLTENMSDMVGLHAADGRLLYVSPSCERLLGYAPQALLEHPPYTLTHPEDAPGVRKAQRQLLEGKRPVVLAHRLRRQDGEYVWCEMTAIPILDGAGNIVQIQTATRDIGDRMAALRLLRESEEKFRAIFNAQPSAVVYTDASGHIQESNPAVDRLFGYREGELIGRNFWLLLSPKADYNELVKRLDAHEERMLWEYPLECQRKDGGRFPAEVTATALGDGGELRGHLWMIRDVSLRERAKLELAEANRRLVSSREEERLHLARELHDGSVQDLIGVSYRLANTVAALKEDAGREALEANLQQLQQEVIEVVKRLRGAISELRPADFDAFGFEAALEGYLVKATRLQEGAMPKVHLRLEGEVDRLSPPVKICLFRTFQEAVANALKHASANEVTVRLSRTPSEVLLVVEDDGCGFETPQDLAELTKDDHFGLVGIQERVALMGGVFSLRTQRGLGSEISVTLPLQKEDELHG